jgi:jumonji domain-containing protein 7
MQADSVQVVNGEATFCYPAETHMTMSTFRAMMEAPEPDDAVPYLSEQDNNFNKSFPELRGDIASSIPLADEAFGCLPEATNIWIGDERSVSSLHKGCLDSSTD